MRRLLITLLFTTYVFAVEAPVQKNTEYPLPQQEIQVRGFEYQKTEIENKTSELDQAKRIEELVKKINPEEILSQKVDIKPDVTDVIRFDTLSAQNAAFQDLIERIKKLHSEKPIAFIHIIGHTDNQHIRGGATQQFKDNWVLSESRAKLVANALEEAKTGVPISVEGKADTVPVATNETPEGRALNRRTDVFIYFDRSQIIEEHQKRRKTLLSELSCEPNSNLEKAANEPMRVTLDGKSFEHPEVKDENLTNHVDFQRCTDVELEKAKIQVHFDPKKNQKRLSLLVKDNFFSLSEPNTYSIYTNYFYFIDKAELRFSKSTDTNSPFAIFPLNKTESSFENLDVSEIELTEGSIFYASLRVYDANGKFDDTEPMLIKVAKDPNLNRENTSLYRLWGETRLRSSNIKTPGGTLWVNGKEVPQDYKVYVMKNEIPIGVNHKFIEEQILPGGKNYGVQVMLKDSEDKTSMLFQRDLYLPQNDWFLVGIADATVGYNIADKNAKVITQDTHHYGDKIYLDARTAFYLKGKIKGEYLLTASADTREGAIDKIFSNFLDKDPQELLRRLDPDEYYPVYGDDSTLVEDAPTSGKFYVKLEKDKNYIMWGNYKISWNDTELARVNRGYYGALLHVDEGQNKWGDSKTKLDIMAADPGTVSGIDQFRGGSSEFSLRNRDLSLGSEQVYVEIRDAGSGRVLKRNKLRYGEDYQVNYIQGIISLNELLPSAADQSTLVQGGSYIGQPVYLVVTYEYVPGFLDPNVWNFGGRASQWIGDYFQVGATARKETGSGSEEELYAGDLKIKLSPKSEIRAELAQSKGVGTTENTSLDGGYNFNQNLSLTAPQKTAQAYLIESDLSLFTVAEREALLSTYYQHRDANFSAQGQLTPRERLDMGGKFEVPLSHWLKINTQYDFSKETAWIESQQLESNAEIDFTQNWYTQIGARSDKQEDLSLGSSSTTLVGVEFGERIDGAVKAGYREGNKLNVYGKAQQTLSKDNTRSRNNRYGGGAEAQVTKDIKIKGEGTGGDGGMAALAGASYNIAPQSQIYTGYVTETDRTDSGFRARSGTRMSEWVSGVKSQANEKTSVNYENKYIHGDRPTGLTHVFGVDYKPWEEWRFRSRVEFGRLQSPDKTQTNDRKSYSLGVDYSTPKTSVGTDFEARFDNVKTASSNDDRKTYVSKTKFSSRLDEEWRVLAKFNFSTSESSKGDYYDGDYKEGALGLAYRPIYNDKFNFLFKYRYYELLPSSGQIDSQGNTPEFQQRDHILSGDTIWDFSQRWSLGLKYAMDFSSLKNNRVGAGPWFDVFKQLGIVRLDYHVLKEWDFLGELRALSLKQQSQNQIKSGALFGIYRILGTQDRLRIGAGYNFTSFTDDLTYNDYKAQGVFINLIGVY
ncbi:MAG: OmpA family protein [Bdellovibrionota bacterium]